MHPFRRFLCDERGLETVEYAIIVGLVVGGLILTLAAIGSWARARYETLRSDLGA